MIGFVGLSHLGISYSLATAAQGFEVLAFDPSVDLVEELTHGRFPVEEPGLTELFAGNRHRLHFSAHEKGLSDCDLVFVSLDIKTDDNNRSDLVPLQQLIERVALHLKKNSTLVILSQVPPGFTRNLRAELLFKGFEGEVVYQVETLVFGRAVERALHPERFIVGANSPETALPVPLQKWHSSFECPVLLMRYESAELAKIAINFFLVSSVATTNTLAGVCENIGALWSEIAPALRLDARIGPKAYLTPGLGIAGGNLERDLVTVKRLAASGNIDSGIIDAWVQNSEYRKSWPARTFHEAAQTCGLDLKEASVAVWGLAYKENTHSIKNSASLRFIEAMPDCLKRAFDPAVRLPGGAYPHFQQFTTAMECCEGADVLAVLTPWPEFRSIHLRDVRGAMRGNILLDPFGLFESAEARALGFDCYQLGYPPCTRER